MLLEDRPAARWTTLGVVAVINLSLLLAILASVDIFLAQTPLLLRVAREALRAAPAVSAFSCFLASAWMCLFWPRGRTGAIAAASLLAFPAVSLAVLARTPFVEWMFARASDVQLAPVTSFADVGDTDMVIGVTAGGETRAYPVRYLAFHHMLNDRLGGAAILPTY
jgi:hypothetical protein